MADRILQGNAVTDFAANTGRTLQGGFNTGRALQGGFNTGRALQGDYPAINNFTTTNVTNALDSIIKTGSATPKMATLVNPNTGERKAVAMGSEDEQQLFSQGFILETATSTNLTAPNAAGAQATTTATGRLTAPIATEIQSTGGLDISSLRADAARLRQEAFEGVFGYRPSEWNNLSPQVQRRLMNQRVSSILAERGNVLDAINIAKEEQAATRDTALENYNFALKAGVTDQLSPEMLQQVSNETGLSVEALKKMGTSEEIPELRSVGGNLYQISWNPNTQQFESKLVIGKPSGGGGGGGSKKTASSSLREVYDAETGEYLGQRNVPDEIEGDKVLYDKNTDSYKSTSETEGGGDIDSLIENALKQIGG